MSQSGSLRRTPLYPCHLEAGARLVDFAGWEMPVQYAGLIAEHQAVRTAAGLFDVSHMGEVRVAGAGATAFLQRLTPNDVSKLAPGRAHYSALLTEAGTYVDDLLVYRLAEEEYLLVVNASNREKDFAWITEHAPAGLELADLSEDYALLALQGPKALEILSGLTAVDLASIRYYGFAQGEVGGHQTLISRTGYTGEDGFELYLPPAAAPELWRLLLAAGTPHGLMPAGLGARDTLRLEAAMTLYGHEIDDQTTPWEAKLDWTIKLEKGDFIGRDALVAQRAAGPTRQLVGFEVVGRGIARQGHGVVAGGRQVGVVTSGTFSPTFQKALGLAIVPVQMATIGQTLTVDVRGREIEAAVVATPFYRRAR